MVDNNVFLQTTTNLSGVDQDSIASTAIRYGLDTPGIKSLAGEIFPHQFRPALGPTQPPIQLVLGHFWR